MTFESARISHSGGTSSTLGEHPPFTRVFIIGQTKQWVNNTNNTNNAPSPGNKRGAEQLERIKIEVVKRCVLPLDVHCGCMGVLRALVGILIFLGHLVVHSARLFVRVFPFSFSLSRFISFVYFLCLGLFRCTLYSWFYVAALDEEYVSTYFFGHHTCWLFNGFSYKL